MRTQSRESSHVRSESTCTTYRRDDSLLGAIQGAPAAALSSSLLYEIVLVEVTCQFTGKETSLTW
jgi:hypothetical protein